jgi:hypothetical protein
MAKNYYLKFGTGSPANFTGLTPTFTIFALRGITAIAAPGITESPVGSGLYGFVYGPTISIIALADGGAALSSGDRYIPVALDPIQAVDEKVGFTTDSFGSTSADPSTLLGYAKRQQEFNEGNAVFTKATGIWDVYSRGSSTLLAEKTLTNTTTAAGKT